MYKICERCRLHEDCQNPVIGGKGKIESAKVIVLLDYPDISADEGDDAVAIKMIEKHMKKISKYITYLVKCCPYEEPGDPEEGTRDPLDHEVNYCHKILEKEIKNSKAVLMPLGEDALRTLCDGADCWEDDKDDLPPHLNTSPRWTLAMGAEDHHNQ